MSNFGKYLKKLRGKRSLREMERLTEISHTYLSTLEKGCDPRSGKDIHPTPEVLRVISEKLNVNYMTLLIKAGYVTASDIKTFLNGDDMGTNLKLRNEVSVHN